MAPEVLQGQEYEIEAEWWAFGCLLYELLVGVPPFLVSNQNINLLSTASQGQNLRKLITQTEPKLDFKFLKKDARDLIRKLLEKDPKKRLGAASIDEIRQHAWFADVAWS